MNRIILFGLFIFYFDIIILQALPIDDYKELDCSAQDDEVLSKRSKRAAKSLSKYPIWPNAMVYYTIDCPNFTKEELHLLRASLDDIEAKTCVKFVQIKGEGKIKGFIHVRCQPDDGCKSELGYQGNPQQLNLQVHRSRDADKGGCMTMRKIQHEFLHALGFRHEHNSPIRDKYVKIMKQNIASGWDYYFHTDNPAEYDNYGCPYDYNSVMHVDGYRHSGNKKPTIIPLDNHYNVDTIGKADSLSACDVNRIRNMYCSRKRRG